jgi:hypothetical protein
MKVKPRFLGMVPLPGRRRLQIVGSGNTIQLLETALVIEGHRKRLWFPLVGGLFHPLLSEWTTMTVPYSTILSYRYASRWRLRVVLTVLLWVPFLLCALEASHAVVRPELVAWLVIFGVVGLVLTAYFNLRLLTARGLLLFRRADGRRVLAAFRIRSRQKRAAFGELLERNRAGAAGRGRDDPARPGPGGPAPRLGPGGTD